MMPHLPQKKILNNFVNMSDREIQERKQGIEGYLNIVMNEKIYFCPALFEFFNFEIDEINDFLQNEHNHVNYFFI